MEIPYYKQETDYSCGPAAMRMVLESLDIEISEKKLVELMKTNKSSGTESKEFPQLAKQYELDYVVGRNTSLQDLTECLRKGFAIIVTITPRMMRATMLL